jgi:hypothetical protein
MITDIVEIEYQHHNVHFFIPLVFESQIICQI